MEVGTMVFLERSVKEEEKHPPMTHLCKTSFPWTAPPLGAMEANCCVSPQETLGSCSQQQGVNWGVWDPDSYWTS